jgi:hypothetical protein
MLIRVVMGEDDVLLREGITGILDRSGGTALDLEIFARMVGRRRGPARSTS